MGLLSWFFGGGPRAEPQVRVRRTPAWRGSGDFDFEVVGESHYQDALTSICGGYCEEGHEYACTATIIPEQNNRYDKNAVAIYIRGQKVAHLSREDAAEYRADLRSAGLGLVAVECDAMIVGGWDRGARGMGHFGVKLDLDLPLSLK